MIIRGRKQNFIARSQKKHADGEDTSGSSKFDWNKLIENVGTTISSIFSGLTTAKTAAMNQQYYNETQRKSNTTMIIGIVVAVIVIVGILVYVRKK
jgi:hypothetical protein